MKIALLAALLILLAVSCGDESAPPVLQINLDAVTCKQESNCKVYLDDAEVGTLQPGGSMGIGVEQGNHTLSARCQSGRSWPATTLFVSGGILIHNLSCQ